MATAAIGNQQRNERGDFFHSFRNRFLQDNPANYEYIRKYIIYT